MRKGKLRERNSKRASSWIAHIGVNFVRLQQSSSASSILEIEASPRSSFALKLELNNKTKHRQTGR